MDVSGSPHRGVLRADDMARWQPTIEAPLTYDYGRYTVCKPGVWSQGPVMLQQLALLKGFELDGLDPTGPEFIHLQIGMRQACVCRSREILRRPQIHRHPDRDPAVGRLQRRAAQADRQDKASLDFVPRFGRRFRIDLKLSRAEAIARRSAAMGAGEPTVGRFGEVRGDTVISDIIGPGGKHDPRRRRRWLAAILTVIPELASVSAAAPRCSGSRKTSRALAPASAAHHAVADHLPRDGEP